jgi:hypothetical protein
MKTFRLIAAAVCLCGLCACQTSKTSANMDVSSGAACKDGSKSCSGQAKSGCCSDAKAKAKATETN